MTDLELVMPSLEDGERRQLHLVTRDVVHQYFMFGFEVCQTITHAGYVKIPIIMLFH